MTRGRGPWLEKDGDYRDNKLTHTTLSSRIIHHGFTCPLAGLGGYVHAWPVRSSLLLHINLVKLRPLHLRNDRARDVKVWSGRKSALVIFETSLTLRA